MYIYYAHNNCYRCGVCLGMMLVLIIIVVANLMTTSIAKSIKMRIAWLHGHDNGDDTLSSSICTSVVCPVSCFLFLLILLGLQGFPGYIGVPTVLVHGLPARPAHADGRGEGDPNLTPDIDRFLHATFACFLQVVLGPCFTCFSIYCWVSISLAFGNLTFNPNPTISPTVSLVINT